MKFEDFYSNNLKLHLNGYHWGSAGLLVVFHRCFPAPKASGSRIHCTLTESILVIYDVEFRLDRHVRFFAEHGIPNHGSLLKFHDVPL
jgi:hypothetical protein